jgi:hypothetical protein
MQILQLKMVNCEQNVRKDCDYQQLANSNCLVLVCIFGADLIFYQL